MQYEDKDSVSNEWHDGIWEKGSIGIKAMVFLQNSCRQFHLQRHEVGLSVLWYVEIKHCPYSHLERMYVCCVICWQNRPICAYFFPSTHSWVSLNLKCLVHHLFSHSYRVEQLRFFWLRKGWTEQLPEAANVSQRDWPRNHFFLSQGLSTLLSQYLGAKGKTGIWNSGCRTLHYTLQD